MVAANAAPKFGFIQNKTCNRVQLKIFTLSINKITFKQRLNVEN